MMLPRDVFDTIKTDEPIDATKLQNLRLRSIVSKIIVLLTEDELTKDDIEALIQVKLPTSISKVKELAEEKLWGKKGYELTLLDMDNVLAND